MSGLNVEQLRRQVTALANAVAGKQAGRTAIANQIAAVNAMPASKADLKEMVAGWIDDSAAQYSKGLKIVLEPFQNNWSRGPTAQNSLELLHRVTGRNAAGLHVTPGPEGLFFLLNAPIKAALSTAIDGLDLPDGIDKADRTARLKELSAQLGQIDAELAELTDLANASGINAGDFEVATEVREARRLAALAEKRAADEAKRRERQDSMPCGDFPDDRQTIRPRTSDMSPFEAGQARIDAIAARRGG